MRQRGIIGFSGFGLDPSICPPGQYGIPPVCVTLPSQVPTQPGATGCPAGSVGYPPYCYPMLSEQQIPSLPPINPSQPCPARTTGIYPSCVTLAVPGQPPSTPAAPPAPSGQQQQAVEKPSWWSQRTDTEKWLVVGVGVLGAVSLLALIKGAATPSYSENDGEPAPEPEKAKANRRRSRRRLRSPKA
jgi:hypothetical protein